jgi:hypothetical protein
VKAARVTIRQAQDLAVGACREAQLFPVKARNRDRLFRNRALGNLKSMWTRTAFTWSWPILELRRPISVTFILTSIAEHSGMRPMIMLILGALLLVVGGVLDSVFRLS